MSVRQVGASRWKSRISIKVNTGPPSTSQHGHPKPELPLVALPRDSASREEEDEPQDSVVSSGAHSICCKFCENSNEVMSSRKLDRNWSSSRPLRLCRKHTMDHFEAMAELKAACKLRLKETVLKGTFDANSAWPTPGSCDSSPGLAFGESECTLSPGPSTPAQSPDTSDFSSPYSTGPQHSSPQVGLVTSRGDGFDIKIPWSAQTLEMEDPFQDSSRGMSEDVRRKLLKQKAQLVMSMRPWAKACDRAMTGFKTNTKMVSSLRVQGAV